MKYVKGQQIYKYILKSYIGGGNFGEVWLANDAAIASDFAVKFLDQKDYSIDERLLEAQIGHRLHHTNVVNITGADVLDITGNAVVAIAMPYLQNGSITNHVNSLNFIDLKKSIRCVIDILRGLEYLHEHSFFHCDIKPSNILVGNVGEYLLSDYGITCFSPTHNYVSPKQTYLPHRAPETLNGNVYDIRTDIYQLGLTTFRLFNGISEIKDDFLSDRTSFDAKIKEGKVIIPAKYKPYVPHTIRRIINKATALNPNDRYQTALDMRRAFEQVQVPGDCTSDSAGQLILCRDDNQYRYDIVCIGKNLFNLDAFKRTIKTGRETRYTKYCLKNLTKKELEKNIQNFCLDIICN